MIVQLHFDEETEKKLKIIAAVASADLKKEYTIADICMGAVIIYLREHCKEVK